jgi:hypothetical protein
VVKRDRIIRNLHKNQTDMKKRQQRERDRERDRERRRRRRTLKM